MAVTLLVVALMTALVVADTTKGERARAHSECTRRLASLGGKRARCGAAHRRRRVLRGHAVSVAMTTRLRLFCCHGVVRSLPVKTKLFPSCFFLAAACIDAGVECRKQCGNPAIWKWFTVRVACVLVCARAIATSESLPADLTRYCAARCSDFLFLVLVRLAHTYAHTHARTVNARTHC